MFELLTFSSKYLLIFFIKFSLILNIFRGTPKQVSRILRLKTSFVDEMTFSLIYLIKNYSQISKDIRSGKREGH